ncbi:anti sigma factor C-terminal domain-containing protein [Alkalibacter mobilis]|uniref:anti sigma factor C-terminal domain-containing protein n=1 Tax=Alkalibacter mobilis TaxID=2787712 RepID=UPI0018A064F6|nr:anti sigma factor C-terminal domain-containing protein [Alkalibacter mobilis]MBF7095644.1 anti sigma factor C-terminal domain-containing protein [Alkalibacter mobilis]
MSENFREMLDLYKSGKLEAQEATRLENEITKVSAIMDYLNEEDETLWSELQDSLSKGDLENNTKPANFKRKVNIRIIATTAATVIFIMALTVLLTFFAGRATSSLFGFDYKEAYVERATLAQITEMFHPNYDVGSSYGTSSLFARQSMGVDLNNTVGHTQIDSKEIVVNYRLGSPKSSNISDSMLFYYEKENFASLTGIPSDPVSGFDPLETAPAGTKAKVLILFKTELTPKEINDNFIEELDTDPNDPLQITPLTLVSSEIVVANPSYYGYTPVYPYGEDQKDVNENRGELQAVFESYDNQAHTDSLVKNLQMLQTNDALLATLYHDELLALMDIDKAIEEIEQTGVKYFGAFITADTKDILKFKGDPIVHSISVENIVLW